MRKFLFSFLLFLSVYSEGQTLTNAQVYDFMPGDVFQWTHKDIYPSWSSSSCGYPFITIYHTDSVLAKSYSALSDTIFYTIHSIVYMPVQCNPTLPPYYSSSVVTKYYTNLSDTASHYNYLTTCLAPTDTFYSATNYCGKDLWNRHSNEDSLCFEQSVWSSTLIEGCGGPYVDLQDMSWSNQWYTEELVYYKKNGVPCGTVITVGIKESTPEIISMFPNPASSVINFEGIKQGWYYIISDLLGRTITSDHFTSKSIDISKFERGTYIITVVSDKEERTSLILIKN